MKNLPQSTVFIKVYREYVQDILDHVGTPAEDIDYNGDWAIISWHANGGVEEFELEQKIKSTGAGEPKIVELS
tara:strand:+ start:10423 stop:10641 length:219 start_codon:yes stop_codon:yes gene_type:complete